MCSYYFRINGESVVPYTVKEGTKYVPLFYFEGETDHLKLKSETVNGWDLAYLKFCCKVSFFFLSERCQTVDVFFKACDVSFLFSLPGPGYPE